jgi:hypothetical protein
MYIKILSCQKPDVSERNDAVSFLQIWEITPEDESKWIFSGWMFASSPGLSAMDHPIYDVWVIDCFADTPPADPSKKDDIKTSPSGPGIEDVLKDAVGSDQPKDAPAASDTPELNAELPPMVDQDFKR